jgi:hypothetical protein
VRAANIDDWQITITDAEGRFIQNLGVDPKPLPPEQHLLLG